MIHKEGIKSLFSGLNIYMLALVPNSAIYFLLYSQLQTQYTKKNSIFCTLKPITFDIYNTIISSFITLIFLQPLWILKLRIQIQGIVYNTTTTNSKYNNTNIYSTIHDGLYKIYHNEGIKGFYKGIIPQLFGLSHAIIYFPLYEHCKRYYTHNYTQNITSQEILLSIIFSKCVAMTFTYPHEIVRTKLQAQDHMHAISSSNNHHIDTSIFSIIKNIYNKNGLIGFYRGFIISMLRAVPASMTTFYIYENVLRWFARNGS